MSETSIDSIIPPHSNICFVLPDGMGLGGVTSWSIKMAKALAARGRTVSLLEHVNPYTGWREEVPPTVRLMRHSGTRPAVAQEDTIPQFLPAYQAVLPGIIVPNYTPGTYAACAALSHSRAEEMRILGFAHSDEPYYYDLLAYYEPIIHRYVAVSQEVAANLTARLAHRRDDIVIRPYGVEVSPGLQRSYSVSYEPLQLVYAGRVVERQKRVSDLIRLTEALIERKVNFHLLLIGEGKDKESLLRAVQDLGSVAQKRVEFAGRVPAQQMADVWRTADVCILVSEYEGTSIAMLEAMTEGCVPVITRVSGTAAVIVPGQNGYQIEVGDMAAMAETIQLLAQNRDLLTDLGMNAYDTIAKNYSYPEYVTWFDDMVDELWTLPPRSWPEDRPLLAKRPRKNDPIFTILCRKVRTGMRLLSRLKPGTGFDKKS